MSGLDESLVLDSLHLEIDLQREAIHLDSLPQNDRGMDLCLGGSVPLASRAGHELKGAQKAGWEAWSTRARNLSSRFRLTGVSHGEELFGILTVSLSTDAFWGCQFQAQRDIAIRFDGAVATLSDGGSVGDILTTGSVGHAYRDRVLLTSVSLTVTIVLLGTAEKAVRTARREAAVPSIVLMCTRTNRDGPALE